MYFLDKRDQSFLYVKHFFSNSTVARSEKNRLFYIEYFILIDSLFIWLEIDNKFILFFSDVSALVHLVTRYSPKLTACNYKPFALAMFKLLSLFSKTNKIKKSWIYNLIFRD